MPAHFRSALLAFLATPFALQATAFGQLHDDCSDARAIFGEVAFLADNTLNTTSSFGAGTVCGPAIWFDQFFQWTSPGPGRYAFKAYGNE